MYNCVPKSTCLPKISIEELVYTFSFNDYSCFIRLFKKNMEKTPQEYRETMR